MIYKNIQDIQCLQHPVILNSYIPYIRFSKFLSLGFCAWRPDKFLLKTHPNLQSKFIEIIGTEPIPKYFGKEPEISKISSIIQTPSDHYGLEIILEFI